MDLRAEINKRLKTQPIPITAGDTDHREYVIDVLEQIAKYDNIDDILDNVIFIFQSTPALTTNWKHPSPSVTISFNLPKLWIDEIANYGRFYQGRIKDIIAHECAHYN